MTAPSLQVGSLAESKHCLAVSPQRLTMFLSELGQIGRAESGGFFREALTDADHAARLRYLGWAKDAGFSSAYDSAGNLFVQLVGRKPALAPVMTGSHLDTQPDGGGYDGILGVVSGLEALCAIQATGIQPRRSIEVAVWMNEEGSRFTPGCMGSRAFVEPELLGHFRKIADDGGTTLGTELDRLNKLMPPHVERRPLGGKVHRFVELHIEQGPLLEQASRVFGIVEGVQGYRRYTVDVIGESAHSGTTPRRNRKDALLAAIDIIRCLADKFEDKADALRFTVGKMALEPNSPFVVPGRVKFWVDIRHPERETLEQSDVALRMICNSVDGWEIRVQPLSAMDPIHFSPEIVDSIEAHAAKQKESSMRIFSGAGHDAQMLHLICPSGMIFVPCKRGISHSPKEDIQLEHAHAGAQLLAELLTDWAET